MSCVDLLNAGKVAVLNSVLFINFTLLQKNSPTFYNGKKFDAFVLQKSTA